MSRLTVSVCVLVVCCLCGAIFADQPTATPARPTVTTAQPTVAPAAPASTCAGPTAAPQTAAPTTTVRQTYTAYYAPAAPAPVPASTYYCPPTQPDYRPYNQAMSWGWSPFPGYRR